MSIEKNSIHAVIFDLDDTLFDHKSARRHALHRVHLEFDLLKNHFSFEVFFSHWLSEAESIRTMSSSLKESDQKFLRVQNLWKACGQLPTQQEVDRLWKLYEEEFEKYWRLFPATVPLLKQLKGDGLKIGVITNGSSRLQRRKIEFFQLEPYFDSIIISEEVGCEKPAPQIFQKSLSDLKCSASEAIFVGDRFDVDVVGAHGSGVRAIWLNAGFTARPQDLLGCLECSELDEVKEILRRPHDILNFFDNA